MPVFTEYRYQLLPNIKSDLFNYDKEISKSEIVQKKNQLFFEMLNTNPEFKSNNQGKKNKQVKELSTKFIKISEDITIFKIGTKKKIAINTKDLEKIEEEDWPSVLIKIDNKPDVQKIWVESNTKAFYSTDTVMSILSDTFNQYLEHKNLSVYIENIYEVSEFWDVIKKYKGEITRVTFDMISPNMANISEGLKFDLRGLKDSTNASNTKIELACDPKSNLNIMPGNETIDSLVNYSGQGGGHIKIKVKLLKKSLDTKQMHKTVTFEDLEIEGNAEDVKKTMDKLFE